MGRGGGGVRDPRGGAGGRAWIVLPPDTLHSPHRESILVVLGQHFFNQTTDVTQTFGIEKYIPYPMYSVFNPSDHDLGKPWDMLGRTRAMDMCVCLAHPRPESGEGQGWVGIRPTWGEGKGGKGQEKRQRGKGGSRGRGGQQGNSVWQSGLGLAGGKPGRSALLSPGPAPLLLGPCMDPHIPGCPLVSLSLGQS